jgi:hypothetical protein
LEVRKPGIGEVQKSGNWGKSRSPEIGGSPEVQKYGSPVITIAIPYYQVLMHYAYDWTSELLDFRTS